MCTTSTTMAVKLKKAASKLHTKQVKHVGRRTQISTQSTLACEHVSTQDTLARDHVSTHGTLAREHVHMPNKLAPEHAIRT